MEAIGLVSMNTCFIALLSVLANTFERIFESGQSVAQVSSFLSCRSPFFKWDTRHQNHWGYSELVLFLMVMAPNTQQKWKRRVGWAVAHYHLKRHARKRVALNRADFGKVKTFYTTIRVILTTVCCWHFMKTLNNHSSMTRQHLTGIILQNPEFWHETLDGAVRYI